MSEDQKRVVEIGGVKMEIDLRYAKTIENYRVGDKVKVLKKNYGDSFTSYPGIIVGFDDFKNLPTIVIAYVHADYSGAKIEFIYLNSATKEVEICPMVKDEIMLNKNTALGFFDREIEKKRHELEDLEMKKKYFLDTFGQHFAPEPQAETIEKQG